MPFHFIAGFCSTIACMVYLLRLADAKSLKHKLHSGLKVTVAFRIACNTHTHSYSEDMKNKEQTTLWIITTKYYIGGH